MQQSNWRGQLFRLEKQQQKILNLKAIDVGKTGVIDAGKKLVEKEGC